MYSRTTGTQWFWRGIASRVMARRRTTAQPMFMTFGMAGLSDASSNRGAEGVSRCLGIFTIAMIFRPLGAWLGGLFKNNVTLPHRLSRQTGANLCL